MTKHEIIRHVLGMSYTDYDNYRLGCFGLWCQHWAGRKGLPLGMMQRNRMLYNWYCTQWVSQVELAFYAHYEYYILEGVDAPAIYRYIFQGYPTEIQAYYPGALLRAIERQWKIKTDG